MPAFLEAKLKKEYGANSSTPYKVMNSIGAMHGSKVTAKGRAMQAKHDAKSRKRVNIGDLMKRGKSDEDEDDA